MKKNVLIGFLVVVLVFVSFGAWSKTEELGECRYELDNCISEIDALKELGRVGSGFYSITSHEVAQSIWFFAGSECAGRRNGTEGSRKAGDFILKELDDYFLDRIFFQDFNFSEVKNSLRDLSALDYLKKQGYQVSYNGRNIVGILEGTNKKEEYVVICAHYDHMGTKDEEVFPGADDNASGTSAVLEIAEAFGVLAKEGIRPERSIIFLFCDAEEMGLWGSQYFAQNPSVPFDSIVAVINLDMIGRNEPNKLEVIGSQYVKDFSEKNPQLYQATIKANEILGFELVYPSAFAASHQSFVFFLSDQASFFLASPPCNRLPVVFYHSGLHEDYHTPFDIPEKINFEKVQNIARFSFFVAWQIANLGQRPAYKN